MMSENEQAAAPQPAAPQPAAPQPAAPQPAAPQPAARRNAFEEMMKSSTARTAESPAAASGGGARSGGGGGVAAAAAAAGDDGAAVADGPDPDATDSSGRRINRRRGVHGEATKNKQVSSKAARKWKKEFDWLVLCNCDDDSVDPKDIGKRWMLCTLCTEANKDNAFTGDGCYLIMKAKVVAHEKCNDHKELANARAAALAPESKKKETPTIDGWRAEQHRKLARAREAFMELAYTNNKLVTRPFSQFREDVAAHNRANQRPAWGVWWVWVHGAVCVGRGGGWRAGGGRGQQGGGRRQAFSHCCPHTTQAQS